MPFNPFAGWRVTGSWAAHASYSLGGEDYPLPYGTPLPAPASGTLRVSGGSGEFKAGWVGSAGRRSVLILDSPIRDVVAVVFQHQSRFGVEKHYVEGVTAGWSGASANGLDYGGDVHLHIHCLTAGGARRKFTDYFTATSPTATTSGSGPTNTIQEDELPTTNQVWDEAQQSLGGNAPSVVLRDTRSAVEDIRGAVAPLAAILRSLGDSVNAEGRSLRAYLNVDTGIYAVGRPGYWWELSPGDDKSIEEKRAFGVATLAMYQARGFAQQFVFEMNASNWEYTRMLCLNTGATPEAKLLLSLTTDTLAAAIERAVAAKDIEVDIDAKAIADEVATELAARLVA